MPDYEALPGTNITQTAKMPQFVLYREVCVLKLPGRREERSKTRNLELLLSFFMGRVLVLV